MDKFSRMRRRRRGFGFHAVKIMMYVLWGAYFLYIGVVISHIRILARYFRGFFFWSFSFIVFFSFMRVVGERCAGCFRVAETVGSAFFVSGGIGFGQDDDDSRFLCVIGGRGGGNESYFYFNACV